MAAGSLCTDLSGIGSTQRGLSRWESRKPNISLGRDTLPGCRRSTVRVFTEPRHPQCVLTVLSMFVNLYNIPFSVACFSWKKKKKKKKVWQAIFFFVLKSSLKNNNKVLLNHGLYV